MKLTAEDALERYKNMVWDREENGDLYAWDYNDDQGKLTSCMVISMIPWDDTGFRMFLKPPEE